jgi:hypothetical protein
VTVTAGETGGSSDSAAVVGLNGADRHKHIGASIIGLTQQVLKFADFVTADTNGSEVVTFDPELASQLV